jgi:hypothetical protein
MIACMLIQPQAATSFLACAMLKENMLSCSMLGKGYGLKKKGAHIGLLRLKCFNFA